jgi:hypothetical protein
MIHPLVEYMCKLCVAEGGAAYMKASQMPTFGPKSRGSLTALAWTIGAIAIPME